MAVDPITLAVLQGSLEQIADEMDATLERMAFSPVISDGWDRASGIYHPDNGEVIIQGPRGLPNFIYVMEFTVRSVIEWVTDIAPGDIYIVNDPYLGGTHLMDVKMVKPFFYRGQLTAFVATSGHWPDIGGRVPGGFSTQATEVYQEGLRLPPVKIMQRGEYVKDVWRIILTNHRTPKTSWGDLHAMIGSLNIAETRMHELLERYGAELFAAAGDQLLDYSERWMRSEIQEIPNGVYRFQDCMEDDGVTDQPVWMRLKLIVKDDEIIADWTDSDAQASGPINATFVVTAAATYSAVLHVTNKDIPVNSGCYRPIRLITNPGTVVNVRHPGPSVGGNTETHPHLQNVVMAALSQAVPERAAAAEAGTACNFLFGGVHPETGEYYTNYHFDGGGWGATALHDGNSVMCPVNGNCRNTPAEVLETKYPFLTLEYSLRTDSGGDGKFRGGLGSKRVLRVVGPEITVSALLDRTRTYPWGLFEAGHGAAGGLLVKKKSDSRFRTFSEVYGTVSATKFTRIVLKEGDEVAILSPGGGGYGSPSERTAEKIEDDVRQGLISAAAARTSYGYER